MGIKLKVLHNLEDAHLVADVYQVLLSWLRSGAAQVQVQLGNLQQCKINSNDIIHLNR